MLYLSPTPAPNSICSGHTVCYLLGLKSCCWFQFALLTWKPESKIRIYGNAFIAAVCKWMIWFKLALNCLSIFLSSLRCPFDESPCPCPVQKVHLLRIRWGEEQRKQILLRNKASHYDFQDVFSWQVCLFMKWEILLFRKCKRFPSLCKISYYVIMSHIYIYETIYIYIGDKVFPTLSKLARQ